MAESELINWYDLVKVPNEQYIYLIKLFADISKFLLPILCLVVEFGLEKLGNVEKDAENYDWHHVHRYPVQETDRIKTYTHRKC